MKNLFFGGLSSLLLPLGAYAGQSPSGYQRSYLNASLSANLATTGADVPTKAHRSARQFGTHPGAPLDIHKAQPVQELVVVDAAITAADKGVLRRALKPGVDMVEINSREPGLAQLTRALKAYKNLAAVHIVSHARAGEIWLGSSRITADNIQQEVQAFTALNGSVREGGDLLFYGCDLAANAAGEELLDIISNKTGLDVAASNNLTGNSAEQGDWNLEIKRGQIDTPLAFSEKALVDFSGVLLASNGTKNFSTFTDSGNNLTNTDFVVSAADGSGSHTALNVNQYVGNNSIAYLPVGGTSTGSYFYVKADGTNTTAFELTGLNSDEYSGYHMTNVHIVGVLQSGSTINSSTINGSSGISNETFVFGSTELSAFSGQKLKGFKLYFDCQSGCGVNPIANFEFRSFTIQNAINTPPLPAVTDARISISGGSGTSGAYKIGDTVTATWNNTAGGDNNAGITGVTVDFSQFGGGSSVTASNSSGTWTATYAISAGAIDATNRNVSVTATNSGGNTTTADTTNATVDSIAPTVTDNRISISGGSGAGGAYIIGDTVTASWNNTAGGDNNSDISGVTVNFSQFGGGSAVAASNSSGTWTATYTITAGAIDTTSRNISITATDDAGNTTTTSDTTNATVDNIAPTVTDANISISGASGTGSAYKIGDTVTATWNNTAGGDNNTDTIGSVTADFSQFGGGSAVGASNSAGTWTATYVISAGAIDTANRNISVTATDNAGNTKTTSDTSNVTVDSIAPTVSSIAPSGSPAANAASMDFAVSFSESVNNISTDDFALVSIGTASGSIASVSVATGSSVTVTVNSISGTGTLKLNLNGSTNVVDHVGNGIAAYSSGTSHTVDRDAPAAPSTPDLDAASDTGASNTDNITSDNTPTFTGTAEANSTVTLSSSLSGTLGSTTADGSGNWSFTASTMGNGVHNITATATDAAGNISGSSSALSITLDGPITVTTNSDSGADATIDGSLAVDIADGGGLSLREAMAYVIAGDTVNFSSAMTITLSSGLVVPVNVTFDTSSLGVHTITGSTLTLTGNLTLTDSGSDQLVIGSTLAGAGTITKNGAGRLTLSSASNSGSYSGDVTISAGDLVLVSDSNFSSGTLTLDGGALNNNSSSVSLSIPITLGAGGGTVRVIGVANTVTLSGNITGSGALSKSSPGILVLSGTNNFSGGLTIVGTNGVSVTDGTNLGSGMVTLNTSSLLTLTGTGQTITNAIALAGDATISNSNAMTLAGVVSGAGALTKTGAGTLSLSNTNAYASTTVSAGALGVSGTGSLGSGAVALASGTSLAVTTSTSIANNIAITGTATIDTSAATTVSGVISGGNLVKAGASSLTLSGTNTYTGTTSVNAGTLSVAGDSNLGTASLTLAASSTLTVTGAATIDNAIALSGDATISNANAVTLSGIVSGASNLTKNGAGALTLSATNSQSGAMTVAAGNLLVNGSTANSTTTVANGGTLGGTGTVGGNLSVQSGGTLSPGNSPGILSVNGNLTMASGSTLAIEINGTTAGTGYDQVAVTGAVDVSGATLSVTHNYSSGQGDAYTIIDNDASDAITGTFTGLSEGGTIVAAGNSTPLTASYQAGTGNDFVLVAPINAAPIIADLNGDSAQFIEDGTAALLDTNIAATVTDSDSADFNGGNLTAAIVANRVDAEDVLSILSSGLISVSGATVSYNANPIGTFTGGTGTNDLVVSLNSNATVAAVQALVRNLVYSNSNSTTPNEATRTVRITVNDGDGGTSSNSDISVAVVAINDAPTLSATGNSPTFTEGGADADLFNAISIDTIESSEQITGMVFTITNLADAASENIVVDGTSIALVNGNTPVTATNNFAASVSVSGATATLTLTKAGGISVAAMQTLVDGMAYNNTSISPTTGNRVVTITALTDSGGTANGGVDTASLSVSSTVTVVAVNSAPAVTGAGATTAFVEANNLLSTPVVVDSSLSLSDVDNTTLASATVSITGNFASAEDVLAFTNDGSTMGNVSASYNSATGLLTLTSSGATATLAEWQAALRAVTYTNSSDTPSSATRTISFVVNDGTDNSSAATQSVSVTPVDDSPLISGAPATSVNQDAAYSFTPVATDVDSGSLVFAITNKPSWASFDTATGALTGTPGNGDVGSTTGVVISVSDGNTTSGLAAFDIAVVNVNNAPTISGTPTISIDQDLAYSFTPTASDKDVGDVLTFSITNKPSWASFDSATGALTGTPVHTDVGTTTGIVISVSDGTTSTSLAPFNLEVKNTNTAPQISGSPALTAYISEAYSFVPSSSDSDGDTLTFTATGIPDWMSLDAATGALTGMPSAANLDASYTIGLSVTDGTDTTALADFVLQVKYKSLDPVLAVPVDITLNAKALYTQVSLAQLLGLNDVASQDQIDARLKALASDSANGSDCCTTAPEGLNSANRLLLAPGRHQITWTTTNAQGLKDTGVQTVDVRPLVSFAKSQVAIRGSQVSVRVLLNGVAPVYPLDIPLVVDSATSATASEYSLSSTLAHFDNGAREASITVTLASLPNLGTSDLILGLDDQTPTGSAVNGASTDINSGAANTHKISILEGNAPPVVKLLMQQAGKETTLVTPDGGDVTVTAQVTDLNTGDTHSFDWSATEAEILGAGTASDGSLVFSPVGLSGVHQLRLSVTDSAGASVDTLSLFRVVASLPQLQAGEDSDNDGIDDQTEGLGDDNGNGIPNYLDNTITDNILPEVGLISDGYLIECEPGVRCGVGSFALAGSAGGVQVLDNELGSLAGLNRDTKFNPVGGVFDFVMHDLPAAGQSVRIVVPQQAAIPADAVYRKFQNGSWVSFVEDADNQLYSAAGDAGYCPPPGSSDWQPGLHQGDMCVQLAIEDGGPNDADGLVNAAVADPGAVSAAIPVEPPPPLVDHQVKTKGSGAMGLWMFALLSLLVTPRRWGKALVALILSALGLNAQAGSDTSGVHQYTRLDVYAAKTNQKQSDLEAGLKGFDVQVTQYDNSRTAYSLAYGLQWSPMFYTEVGYLDLGDVKVDFTAAGDTDFAALNSALETEYPITAHGATLTQGLMFKPAERWKLSTEIGVFLWGGDITTNDESVKLDYEDSTDLLVGLRLEYALNQHLSLGLGVKRVLFKYQDVQLTGISASWQF